MYTQTVQSKYIQSHAPTHSPLCAIREMTGVRFVASEALGAATAHTNAHTRHFSDRMVPEGCKEPTSTDFAPGCVQTVLVARTSPKK